MSLRRLPYEIVLLIVQDLSLEDVFHLSLTCRPLLWLSYEDRTCKSILEVLEPQNYSYSPSLQSSPVFATVTSPRHQLMWRSQEHGHHPTQKKPDGPAGTPVPFAA